MTIIEEHNAKLAWINNPLNNKYDYAAYRQFCVDNNFEIMPFSIYAMTIEPPPGVEPVAYLDSSVTTKTCCGGGEIR